MNVTVTIIDYGMGNLYSVSRAFEHVGAHVRLTARADDILTASHLVLPGVGAFRDGMAELERRGVVAAIRDYALDGGRLLAICLGMQMLLEESEEFGRHRGLGLVAGRVSAIPATGRGGKPHKIPHIGWNRLVAPSGISWAGSLLEGLPPETEAYFAHSYTAHPTNESERLADADYDGCLISAMIRKRNVYGCQFHPEKSGPAGLHILTRFLR